MTAFTDLTDTSCSPERPPNITAMRDLILEMNELDDGLAQSGKDEFDGEFDRDIALIEHRVDLDDLERPESAVFCDHLESEVSFPISRAAAYERSRSGSECGRSPSR